MQERCFATLCKLAATRLGSSSRNSNNNRQSVEREVSAVVGYLRSLPVE